MFFCLYYVILFIEYHCVNFDHTAILLFAGMYSLSFVKYCPSLKSYSELVNLFMQRYRRPVTTPPIAAKTNTRRIPINWKPPCPYRFLLFRSKSADLTLKLGPSGSMAIKIAE